MSIVYCSSETTIMMLMKKRKVILSFVVLSLLCLSVVLSNNGCSKSSDTLYKEAKTAEQQKNFPTALEYYNQIVDKDPESAYAESSQYRIAVIYNNELREVEKAAQAYRKFNLLFPQSNDAATCLFLSGFLYNNDLKRHDSGKVIYEEFLQKYPEHELAKSAEFELSTMGKDPSELIVNDTTSRVAAQSSTEEKQKQ